MNNRIIKFRAWDKVNKIMLTTAFSLYGNGTWFHLWQYDAEVNQSYPDLNEGQFKDPEKSQRFEIMQYTGLKDKNGKEIYEGDIVKYFSPKYKASQKISAVIWANTMFAVNDDGLLIRLGSCTRFEVIGNIWENKELLK